MPTSRSPIGIHADWPLQRAWMILESSGSRRRNAATVCGAVPSSRRAVKRKSPETISNIDNPARRTLRPFQPRPLHLPTRTLVEARGLRPRAFAAKRWTSQTPKAQLSGLVNLGALGDPVPEEVA